MKVLVFVLLLAVICFAEMPEYYMGKKADAVEVFQTRADKKIALRWINGSKNKNGPIIVAMNGGHGQWGLKDAHITPSRIGALLAEMKNYRVLSLDMPDELYKKEGKGGYGNESYRLSKDQIDDIKSVLSQINKQNAPVYIFTTSKSTISGINAAASDIPNLSGVILTAVSADLSSLAPFAKTKTLWIHHNRDKCFDAGIDTIRKIAESSKNSTFVEVTNEASVSGRACSMTNYHGFVERDMELAKTIDAWIENRQIQMLIP